MQAKPYFFDGPPMPPSGNGRQRVDPTVQGLGFRHTTPILENHLEKKKDGDVEGGFS